MVGRPRHEPNKSVYGLLRICRTHRSRHAAGVPPHDLGGAGLSRQPLGHELADAVSAIYVCGPRSVTVEVDQAVPGQRHIARITPVRQVVDPVPARRRPLSAPPGDGVTC
jgi:hypothetical protein